MERLLSINLDGIVQISTRINKLMKSAAMIYQNPKSPNVNNIRLNTKSCIAVKHIS